MLLSTDREDGERTAIICGKKENAAGGRRKWSFGIYTMSAGS